MIFHHHEVLVMTSKTELYFAITKCSAKFPYLS